MAEKMKIEYSKKISKAGAYAFAEIDKKVSELKDNGIDAIDFGVGDPKSPPPSFVLEGLSQSAEKRKLYGYPSYIGDPSYREACSEHMMSNFGVTLNPQTEISSTLGSKEAIFNFPIGFINEGDIVICPSPAYPVYKTGTEFCDGIPYLVPLLEENNFLIDFKKIPQDIADKAKVIWINYPNSPTGAIAPLSWLKEFAEWAEVHNIIIASDEGCYIDLYFEDKPHSILEIKKEGVIAFYSLSKRSNMTGYRVGFVAGDEQIISGFRKVKTNIDSGTPIFIQDVAAKALRDSSYTEKMRLEYQKKRDILIPALTSLGLEETPSVSTFYLWQKVPSHMTDVEFSIKLIEKGIVVTPGSMISDEVNGVNPGRSFVRFALVPVMEDIKKAADIIRNMKL
jgi:LL-diaminopimelate aminotransferase